MIGRDGQISHFSERLRPYKVHASFYAIGSGRRLAIGAMAAGASAKEAVEIACRFDTHSRGPVNAARVLKPVKVAA